MEEVILPQGICLRKLLFLQCFHGKVPGFNVQPQLLNWLWEKLALHNEHYVQDHEDITELHVSDSIDSVEFDNADTDSLNVASNSTEIKHLQAQVADLSDKVDWTSKHESFQLETSKMIMS